MHHTATFERPGRSVSAPGEQALASATSWDTTLDRYHRLAAEMLNTHVNDGHRCIECGQSWPCARALAAALALEL